VYLLDTNILSELRRPKPHGAVLAWLASVGETSLSVSAISVGEIQRGIEMAREQDAVHAKTIEEWLHRLVESMPVRPLDAACMIEWARLMHRQQPHLVADAMIAATGRVYNLIVVTRNVRDFRLFPVTTLNPFDFPKN
jgi:predicted nucleic acid-binding protein